MIKIGKPSWQYIQVARIDIISDDCYTMSMSQCSFCDYDAPGRTLFAHQWQEHREQMNQRRLAGMAKRLGRDVSAEGITVTAEGSASPTGQLPDNNGNGSKPLPQAQKKPTPVVTPTGGKLTGNISEAVSLSIAPRAFTMDSSLVWAAMEAAKREWKWPMNMTPQQFLDTYLYESFKQRGLLLGAYQVLWPQSPDAKPPEVIDGNGNGGNGHNGHDGNGNGHNEAESVEYGQDELSPAMASF